MTFLETLQAQLMNLPAPSNKFEVSEDRIMQMEQEIAQQEMEITEQEDQRMRSEEDLEEYEKRMEAERKRYEELAKLKQSSVVRQALPRPLIINQKFFK